MIRPRDLRIENARRCAREWLHRFGVLAPEHIDIDVFAEHLGVTIMTVKLDEADAQLIRSGDRVTILLSDRITSPAVRRFTIAHELGHLLLGHPTQIPSMIPGPGARHVPIAEREASAFASEFLMPAAMVRESCDLSCADLDAPRHISQLYNVSILVGAIRYTELAREPCAAVFAVATGGVGKVKWAARSAPMELRIRRGRLSSSSLASSFFASGRSLCEPRQVPNAAWFDRPSFGRVIEHVVCSMSHRTTLSMVWIQRDVE